MKTTTDEFIAHFGVKGMKWGVRRDRPDNVEVSITERPGRKKLKTSGGDGRSASDDAKTAAVSRQIARRNSTDALSTKELQELVNRMNLEQQYSRLAAGTVSPGRKFVADLLLNVGKQQATRVANEQATVYVNEAVKRAQKS